MPKWKNSTDWDQYQSSVFKYDCSSCAGLGWAGLVAVAGCE